MGLISELYGDLRFILKFRGKVMKRQVGLNKLAPKAGELAPDFTLSDITGTETVTLSDFRGQRPIALVFGSFT